MQPRFKPGQSILVAPQGLAFGSRWYTGVITEAGKRVHDPRFGAPKNAKTYAYSADVVIGQETVDALLYEYEIEATP